MRWYSRHSLSLAELSLADAFRFWGQGREGGEGVSRKRCRHTQSCRTQRWSGMEPGWGQPRHNNSPSAKSRTLRIIIRLVNS